MFGLGYDLTLKRQHLIYEFRPASPLDAVSITKSRKLWIIGSELEFRVEDRKISLNPYGNKPFDIRNRR
jgi:hypothetical protein